MAEAAANALLKTLEEPGRATIILIAPSPDSLLPTLVSRCQRIPFSRLAEAELKQVLAQTDHSEIIEQETILAIAQGSPGEAIATAEYLNNIPSHLLQKLDSLIRESNSSLDTIEFAFNLAKEISNTLEFSGQIWLVNYLQQCYWKQYLHSGFPVDIKANLKQLETTRQMLLNYVQPRLVWEVTFLQILKSATIPI
jgi:DNA polymerase-3 subunit delta'